MYGQARSRASPTSPLFAGLFARLFAVWGNPFTHNYLQFLPWPTPRLSLLLGPFRDSLWTVKTALAPLFSCPWVFLIMSGTDLNFHIGDKVVYPNHGVGVIEQISSRSIGATVEKFYLLNIKASSLKVMVPCNNVGSVGIRRVVRNGEVQKILDFLAVSDDLSTADWKDRFKENSDRMRSGSLYEVAGVLKSLIALHQAKPLSFREKKMLERARYLLVSEIALSRNVEETKIEELLSLALGKCNLRFPEASEFQA